MPATYQPDHYMDYEEMIGILKSWSKQYADLLTLVSLGKSREGRDIWMAVVTDPSTGSADSKPGYWVDANMHAIELAGTQAAMHFLHRILTGFKSEARVQALLERYSLYVVPRISPDGAEYVLKENGMSRSVPVCYPVEESLPGYYQEDVNGDGKILSMLIPDPSGTHKRSKKDPRVILRRQPHENEANETYYRILPEGRRVGEGPESKKVRSPFGHDFNRNFPDRWEPEGGQQGSGPFPLSHPETRAIAEAICSRSNIFGVMNFHTFSAIILRPPIHADPSKMNPMDLHTYESLGAIGEDATGYPCVSIYEGFRYDKSRNITGSLVGWAYECRGIYAFTNEIWHVAKAAGIEIPREGHVRWLFEDLGEDSLLKLIKWCDDNLEPGTYFTPWESFEHPDFGPVEIGGFDRVFLLSNPPKPFLEAEVEKNVEMVMRLAETGPLVEVTKKEVKKVGDQVSLIEIEVANHGYLSTLGAQTAQSSKAVMPPRIQVKLGEGIKLIEGELDFETDHLPGRANIDMIKNPLWANLGFGWDSFQHQKRFFWAVEGQGTVIIDMDFARGGKKQARFEV